MHRLVPIASNVCLVAVLAACQGSRANDTVQASGTTGTTGGPGGSLTTTEGNTAPTSSAGTSTTGASAGSETGATGSGATDSTATGSTATGSTTIGTTASTTTGNTTGGECSIEGPAPGSCNELKPGGRHPGKLVGILDDQEEFVGATEPNFIPTPDFGDTLECDIFAQDCPPGQKCNVWAPHNGVPDGTKCVPIDPNPAPVGAPCWAEASGTFGIDNCPKGSLCWAINPETGEGFCVEFCTCSLDNPICNTPDTACQIVSDTALAICVPVCDPLDPDSCDGGRSCVPAFDGPYFMCLYQYASVGPGGPCEHAQACESAHFCGSPDAFPGCDLDAGGCCIPYCSLADVDCPQGTSCTPWYAPGEAPKCFEDVGACLSP